VTPRPPRPSPQRGPVLLFWCLFVLTAFAASFLAPTPRRAWGQDEEVQYASEEDSLRADSLRADSIRVADSLAA
jgi:hypothetical protein